MQDAKHFEFSKISEQFWSASPQLQDVIRVIGHDFSRTRFPVCRGEAQRSTVLMENTMRKASFPFAMAAMVLVLVFGKVAWADDIRPAMEKANTEFLAAFNTPNPSAFLPLYTTDAVLFFQGAPPVTGPEAIKQFWQSRIKLGVRDHTFEIIEAGTDGKYAFQTSKATVQLVRDTGEKTLIAGHTVRIFEKQSDGTWKTKVHMFNRPNSP
jgi:ketosteroid isomerase-like protein